MSYNLIMAKQSKKIQRIVFLAGPVDARRLKRLQSELELSLQYVIRRALYELAVKEKVEA